VARNSRRDSFSSLDSPSGRSIGDFFGADEPRGREHPRILLRLCVLRDAEVVEPLVGQVIVGVL
jgi:hypothetical protein